MREVKPVHLSVCMLISPSVPAPQSISGVIRIALWLSLIRPVWVLPLTALSACVANTSGLAGGLLPAAISADAFLYVILSSQMCCI